MRRDTKAAVLEGGAECPDLVVFSVYDTNPVNLLSMVAEIFLCNINERISMTRQQRKRSGYSSIEMS